MNKWLLSIVLCCGLLAANTDSFAQSNTRSITADTGLGRMVSRAENSETAPAHKILLVPFRPKMCMSEIGKDVHAATHMEYDQIVQAFRRELDQAMYGALRKNCTPISILQGHSRSDSVLAYIYESTGYKYDIVPGTVADIGAPDKKDNKKNYIHNGQLQVPVDYSKRFMNINISNPNLLNNLGKKYSTDTYIFINELDIKNVANVTENLTDDEYRREVTVHYSIIDKDGKSISKGLATTYFPFRENDPKEIGEKYFTIIARNILKDYAQGLAINNLSEQQKKQAMQGNSVVAPK